MQDMLDGQWSDLSEESSFGRCWGLRPCTQESQGRSAVMTASGSGRDLRRLCGVGEACFEANCGIRGSEGEARVQEARVSVQEARVSVQEARVSGTVLHDCFCPKTVPDTL